jgi:hypothetical protein
MVTRPRVVPFLGAIVVGSLLFLYAAVTCDVMFRVRAPFLGEFVFMFARRSAVEVMR